MKLLKFWLFCSVALLLSFSAANAQGYGVRNGDTLRIEVLEDPELNRSVLVAPDGRITVPMAGSLRATGLTVEAIQRALVNRLESNFALPPNVYVSVERLVEVRPRTQVPVAPVVAPTIDVFLVGEAAKPGKIAISPGTTVLQLFGEMGGFSKFAAVKRIQLRRMDAQTQQTQIYSLNYKDIEQNLTTSGSIVLLDGDTLIIPQRRLFE